MENKKILKVITVMGTRPEVIKMASVIKELRNYPQVNLKIISTSQHRQMLEPLLELFGIKPDYDLNIMQKGQSLEHITVSVLTKLQEILSNEKPDYLFVQGDTTTSMAASLAAFYQKIKVMHIEAGLRSGDKLQPYPEEINRKIIDSISDVCFAPTKQAKQNLLREGIVEENIGITGNTGIDAMLEISKRNLDIKGTILEDTSLNDKKIILVTAHRRENFGEPLINICKAIKEIALKHSSDVSIIYPVHLNPHVQEPVNSILSGIRNVLLIKPLDYVFFTHLMKQSYLILTDSGGIQEEGPSLGKPVLVLRKVTERPEAIEAGVAKLVGVEKDHIVSAVDKLLNDRAEYNRMARAVNPYGDGKAAERIGKMLLYYSGLSEKRPCEFQ